MTTLKELLEVDKTQRENFGTEMKIRREELWQKRVDGIMEVTSNPEAYRAYLETQSQLMNLSPGNTILAMLKCPDATDVRSYHGWKSVGRVPLDYNDSIIIFKEESYIADNVVKQRNSDGEAIVTNNATQKKGYKMVNYYDVSQTDGVPVDKPVELQQDDYNTVAAAVLSGLPVTFAAMEPPALYSPEKLELCISENILEGNITALDLLTICQEAAHAHFHNKGRIIKEYPREAFQLYADSVAYLVCRKYGIGAPAPNFKLDVIAGYDEKERWQRLNNSKDYAEVIINRIDDFLDKSAINLSHDGKGFLTKHNKGQVKKDDLGGR